MKLTGTFYMKSGIVLTDEVEFTEDTSVEDVKDFVEECKKQIKTYFRENIPNGQITFGYTTVRMSDCSAVKIM